ncbi:unnamed protein product [Pedinophyceae sp. YPF-701]|nr:unnamed protein product [Pedinophyceae sp. YPF-701]
MARIAVLPCGPHPVTETLGAVSCDAAPRGGICLLSDARAVDVSHVDQQFASWFAGNEVLARKPLLLGTPMDPLFLALQALDRAAAARGGGPALFAPLDQLLEQGAGGGHAALLPLVLPQAHYLCDKKGVGEEDVFRLSEDRVAAWLTCKVRAAERALRASLDAEVSKAMDDATLRTYAAGIVGESLSERRAADLLRILGVQAAASGENGDSIYGALHASVDREGGKSRKEMQKEAQKAKAKADREEKKRQEAAKVAREHKSITSFFSAKPKSK